MSNTDERREQLADWVSAELQKAHQPLQVVSGDASFRRYFRRVGTGQEPDLIAVDAPPTKESLADFVKVTHLLESAGVNVPQVHHVDYAAGFMLLTDFGDQLMLGAVTSNEIGSRDETGSSSNQIYRQALDALLKIQSVELASSPNITVPADSTGQNLASQSLPAYDRELLLREMQLFPDWLLQRHLGLELSPTETERLAGWFSQLTDSALAQSQVVVHRDFHSRNLLITKTNSPGVIDYQDAVVGPVTYDLVSLLKDCYIAWPRAKQLEWLDYYRQAALNAGFLLPERTQFIRDWDLMGAQRHLKAAGIFARLYHRDGKAGYLPDVPRTMGYLVNVLATYTEFSELADWFTQRLGPAFDKADLNWQGV